MILKDRLEDMSESTSFTVGKLFEMISVSKHLGYFICFKVSDTVDSVPQLRGENEKELEKIKGFDMYVSVNRRDIDKVKKLKIKHAVIGSSIVCDSDLTVKDIEKLVKLEKRDFKFYDPSDGCFISFG